jgi:sugar phosphate permease
VLAAGTAAQTSAAAFGIGVPVVVPAIRDELGLTLPQIGFVLAAEWVGGLLTLFPWGLLADRVGERFVLGAGLGTSGVLLIVAGHASSAAELALLLGLAGMAGASVNAASGRAVMHWFDEDERGFALGIRQTSVPLGGLIAAAALPRLDVEGAFLFLGLLSLGGAAVGLAVLRERGSHEEVAPWTVRDPRIWVLCAASGLYVVTQVTLMSFVVLFLHDERGFSPGEAAAVLAAFNVLAAILRIASGRWSDAVGSRIGPLRLLGAATTVALAVAAALLDAPAAVLVPALVLAGALSMSWNALSFTAAAEMAGRARAGAAIGIQQSSLAASGALAPVLFTAAVSATSWRTAWLLAAVFPLAGAAVLAPLAKSSSGSLAGSGRGSRGRTRRRRPT